MLFLDEVGELGQNEQSMLLRALEEGVFLPMGADNVTASRFQLLRGTDRDLLDQVGKGDFREDLLARINLWTFYLPRLLEKGEDVLISGFGRFSFKGKHARGRTGGNLQSPQA